MNRPFLTLLCLGAASGIIASDFPWTQSAVMPDTERFLATTSTARDTIREPKTIVLEIEGMTCGGCALATRKVLERIDGVRTATVDYETRRAVVTYDPEKITVDRMIAAVKSLGYVARVIEAQPGGRAP
jgi:copper chaperone CopZ